MLINETGGSVLGITDAVAVKMCGTTVPGAQTAVLGIYDPIDTTYGRIEPGADLNTFKLCSTLVLVPGVCGKKGAVLVKASMLQ